MIIDGFEGTYYYTLHVNILTGGKICDTGKKLNKYYNSLAYDIAVKVKLLLFAKFLFIQYTGASIYLMLLFFF